MLALAVFVLLLLLEPGNLFAQQTSPGDQGWSQNDQYYGQHAPAQLSDDGQQSYAQRYSPDSDQAYPQRGYGQAPAQAQPLNAAQLEQLVAPIALYPDALVAQILAASTYSGQVADADHWRQTQRYASSDQIAAGADVENWDPSVKALTAFPQVLARMDRNLQWTTDLGNAYYNQPQDVFEAVQVMRLRAQAAGSLQSTPQQAVHHEQGYIQLMPVNPQVVYVPAYDPWTVYGEQVSPYPGFSQLGAVGSSLGSSPINYGLGIAMSAFSHTPWGWLAWGLNWLTQSVLFNQSDYSSNSTTLAAWGSRDDGMNASSGPDVSARQSYGRAQAGYGQFDSSGYDGNNGQGFRRPQDRYTENQRGDSSRSFQTHGGGYNRTPRPPHDWTPRLAYNHTPRPPYNWTSRSAYNHVPRPPYNRRQAPESRQQFDRRGYVSSFNRGTGEGYFGGMGAAYDRSMQSYRAPRSDLKRGEFGGRSSGAFAGRDFARSTGKPPHSGGFHLFGGSHEPRSVSSRSSGDFHMRGGWKAPKSFNGGKHSGGGHSHGSGGHSGGHGHDKHHR